MIAQVKTDKRPKLGEQSGPQTISYSYGEGILARDFAKFATYKDYRELRLDPTIALARGLLVSGVLAGYWSVEADDNVDEKVVQSIEDLLPLREQIMQNAVGFGRIDYGWVGFEKVFVVKDGRITIERLKPLLAELTHVLNDENGRFKGYKQQQGLGYGYGWMVAPGRNGGGPVYPMELPLEKCLHIAFSIEGGNLYGVPLLENVRAIQAMWKECNDGAKRYDSKIAGSHWIIYYPPGTGVLDGETLDNGVIAKRLLAVLESSGCIAIPTTVATYLQELNSESVAELFAWRVELISDTSPRQVSFVDRLRYLDTLKIRGLLLPERACTEGQYGTKAEAGTHADLAITGMEQIDRSITRVINENVVNQLLILNYGEDMKGKVRLAAAPLMDKQIAFLREMYLKMISDPMSTVGEIDIETLKEHLAIPLAEKVTE